MSASAPPAADDILKPAEVGKWLKLSVRQVQRLRIPYIDCGERSRRYRRGDVLAWLEAQRSDATKSRHDASGSPISAAADS